MFSGKLADMKSHLCDSLHGLMGGYCKLRYNLNDLSNLFTNPDYYDDYFLLYTGEEMMTLATGDATVIDFTKDILSLYRELDTPEKYESFVEMVTDEVLNSPDVNLAFKDMILYVSNVQVRNYPTQEHCIVRMRDVTELYKNEDRYKDFKQIVQISMYSLQGMALKIKNGNIDATVQVKGKEKFYAPVMPPIVLYVHNDGERWQESHRFDKEASAFLYPMQEADGIAKWEAAHTSLAFFVAGAFQFLYKHQKITYKEVQVPEGLQRKRRKRKKEPYESYYVSQLGDFSRNVYTESVKRGGTHGVALHIRRGYWRLKWGHRKLPEDQQKKIFIPSTVAGDPRYGIIVRDYESDLVSGEDVDIAEEMQRVHSEREQARKSSVS